MGSPLRGLTRLIAYVSLTVVLIPFQAFALLAHRRLATEIPLRYHRLCCRILGLNVITHGAVSRTRPTLFVANHVSYIDIPVLASLIRGSFVAKAEIATWPFLGILAKLQRTVFVARIGADTARHRDEMVRRLAAGDSLILFPEGTSDDGKRVLPFKSALFGAAQTTVAGRPVIVQPVSIAYTRLDGMAMGRNFRTYYAWYGDMELVSHLWAWVGLGVATVEVTFHPPTDLAEAGSRKALAQQCREVIALSVATANAGRPRGGAQAMEGMRNAG